MNHDLLIGHFEQICDDPNAIQRLRRFILDLAVRGKLVEQDTNESKPYDSPTQTHLPFSIPDNWSQIELGKCFSMVNGRAFKSTDWLTTGLPIIRIQNLNNPNAPFNYCDPAAVEEKHLVNDNEFLISWSGTPGTSFGAFIWKRGPAALNQHIFKCSAKTDLFYNEYLKIAINGRLDEMIAKAHGGVGLQHITKKKLEALALPVPPLAEQHRIVSKTRDLMKICDQLEHKIIEAKNLRIHFRESAFARALAAD